MRNQGAKKGVCLCLCALLLTASNLAAAAKLQLYPTEVELVEDVLVYHYLLRGDQSPADIQTDNVVLEDVEYQYAYTTATEEISVDIQTVTKTVEHGSASNLADEVLALLAPTYHYAEGGYTGTLDLDVSAVQIADGERKTSYYTASQTREYPGLSSNDAALVPKEITYSGKTYTLADLQWAAQYGQTVDGIPVPTSYTATAKYTAGASSTKVVSYTVTAQYSGTVSALLLEGTRYDVYFTPVPHPPSPPRMSFFDLTGDAGNGVLLLVVIALAVLSVASLVTGIYHIRRRKKGIEKT